MASGAGALAVGRYGVAVLGWAGSLILVRALPREGWGEYSLIFSIMGLIGSFADLKLGRIVIRDLQNAGDRLEDVLGSFVVMRLILGVLCYGLALGVVVAGRYPTIVLAAMAVSGTVLVVSAAGAALYVYFNAQMWMRALAVAGMVGQAIQLALTAGLAVGGYRNLVLFTIPAVIGEFVSLGWQLRAMRHSLRLRIDRARWRAWLGEAVALSIGTTLGSIYGEIDTVMLSKLASLTAVGVYAIGSKFATFTEVISNAVGASLLVAMTRSWPDDPEQIMAAFRRAFLLLFIAGIAVSVEFAAFSAQVVRLLYGQRYVVGHKAAVGLVLAEVLVYFSELCFVTLVVMGRNLAYVVAAGLGVVVNVGLNVVLIPRWSYNGASVATLVTEAVVLLILAGVLSRRGATMAWLPSWGVVKVCAAGGALAIVAFGLRGRVPWEAAAAVAAGVYLIVLHVTRVEGPGGLRALTK